MWIFQPTPRLSRVLGLGYRFTRRPMSDWGRKMGLWVPLPPSRLADSIGLLLSLHQVFGLGICMGGMFVIVQIEI